MEPKGEIHELYELWEESDSFQEWKEHILSLINKLENMKTTI